MTKLTFILSNLCKMFTKMFLSLEGIIGEMLNLTKKTLKNQQISTWG